MLSDIIKIIGKVLTHGVAYSVYGAILFHVIYQYFKNRKFQKNIKLIKNVFPVKGRDLKMDVYCSIEEKVGGSKPPKTMRKYVHSAEALALKLISSKLKDNPLTISTDNFYNIGKTNSNLLLLGGGAYNSKSDELMKEMGHYLRFKSCPNGHSYFEDLKRRKIFRCGCEHKQASENEDKNFVPSDYGVILRRRLNSGKIALVLAGIHMQGTLAAAHVAMNDDFQKFVAERKSEFFAQLVHTEVENDGVRIDPKDIEWRNLPFHELEY